LFQQARSEHRKGAALADLRSALENKLSTDLDAQVLIPHLSETRRRARCDRSPHRDRRTHRPARMTPHSHNTA
jgi:hypothetical protein